MSEAKTLALVGKGGVGKTSLSAAMVRLLTEAHPNRRVLAIDADPAVGLATALGVKTRETLDDIRKGVSCEVAADSAAAHDILSGVRNRLQAAMNKEGGYDFLAVGRPEAAGCYCAVNAYLRQTLALLLGDYDFVVVDAEAGIEQVNRRVLDKVTHLLLVSDASRRGLRVLRTVAQVAGELSPCESCGAILNRIPPALTPEDSDIDGVPILAVIGEDAAQTELDIRGGSVFELRADAPILRGAAEALRKLDIL